LSENGEIAIRIQRKALELGFSACGFSAAQPLNEVEPSYLDWVSAGKAGEMNYLTKNIDVRLNPGKLVDEAKTVISLAAAYYYPLPEHKPGNPRISRYALGEDYHGTLKAMGRELLNWIGQEIGTVRGRVFTDSAPVFEREWARRSGIGWIGKNGCLIIPGEGSWFFLAEIIIDRQIHSEPSPVTDRCGNCTRCLDACPTGALEGNGRMDPRKCISYLTIEHKSEIQGEFKNKWADWVFGCDICQDVCPWNHNPATSRIGAFLPKPGLVEPENDFFLKGDAGAFEKLFDGTPVLRAGWSGILRNFEFLQND